MKRTLPIQIDWKPDKKSTTPIYQQIVQFVCNKVAIGEWPIDTRLPSQRTLAEIFGVNRSTIVTAIEELTSYGIIEGRHGAGTQIVSNTWALLLPPLQTGATMSLLVFFRQTILQFRPLTAWNLYLV